MANSTQAGNLSISCKSFANQDADGNQTLSFNGFSGLSLDLTNCTKQDYDNAFDRASGSLDMTAINLGAFGSAQDFSNLYLRGFVQYVSGTGSYAFTYGSATPVTTFPTFTIDGTTNTFMWIPRGTLVDATHKLVDFVKTGTIVCKIWLGAGPA